MAVVVTVEQINEDGSRVPLDPETAALLAGPVERFTSLVGWTVDGAGALDHGDREKTIEKDGRELQRSLLETTFALDAARERRVSHLVSAARIRHGGVETGHDRDVTVGFEVGERKTGRLRALGRADEGHEVPDRLDGLLIGLRRPPPAALARAVAQHLGQRPHQPGAGQVGQVDGQRAPVEAHGEHQRPHRGHRRLWGWQLLLGGEGGPAAPGPGPGRAGRHAASSAVTRRSASVCSSQSASADSTISWASSNTSR